MWKAEDIRRLDERSIRERGIPGSVLMDRAGQALAREVDRWIHRRGLRHPRIVGLAGKGNNGGDVFAAARSLMAWGHPCTVFLASHLDDVRGDAREHLERLLRAGGEVHALPREDDWCPDVLAHPWPDLVMDGLLGTGARGDPRGVAAAALRALAAARPRAFVVAVDLPSGFDADTGAASALCVPADLTVSLALPKAGFNAPGAPEWTGTVRVADIGIPADLVAGVGPATAERLVWPDVSWDLLKPRPRAGHKGSFGHVLLVGGARGTDGAIHLAARAALRSGAGLVTVATPESVADSVRSGLPEAMVHGGPETPDGRLAALPLCVEARLPEFTAILCGPGLGVEAATRSLVRNLLDAPDVVLVLDADALNALGDHPGPLSHPGQPVVVTPHPGEAGRLLGRTSAEVQADRVQSLDDLVQGLDAVVVLKGAGTRIGLPDGRRYVNLTGGPALAAGGTGDVLAGLIAGLAARARDPSEAALLGVWLHGVAGDLASWRKGETATTAGEVADALPLAWAELGPR